MLKNSLIWLVGCWAFLVVVLATNAEGRTLLAKKAQQADGEARNLLNVRAKKLATKRFLKKDDLDDDDDDDVNELDDDDDDGVDDDDDDGFDDDGDDDDFVPPPPPGGNDNQNNANNNDDEGGVNPAVFAVAGIASVGIALIGLKAVNKAKSASSLPPSSGAAYTSPTPFSSAGNGGGRGGGKSDWDSDGRSVKTSVFNNRVDSRAFFTTGNLFSGKGGKQTLPTAQPTSSPQAGQYVQSSNPRFQGGNGWDDSESAAVSSYGYGGKHDSRAYDFESVAGNSVRFQNNRL